MTTAPILEAEHLCIDYRLNNQWVNAIRDVSLTISAGEIHGLVGESGSGKSTLALALMRYLAPNARVSQGDIRLDGVSLLTKAPAEMERIWGRDLCLVPQDPLAALNPAYTVGEQIAEVTRQHQRLSKREAWRAAVTVLEQVRIAEAESVAAKYPHQLSGGMQQRVVIAMALSTRPRLLILDEPTTALDVTTQAVILDLFRDLLHEHQAAALYVSHDLGVIREMCHRITVLYCGEVMASAPVENVYRHPTHPYTIGLLASIPRVEIGASDTRLPTIPGTAPSLQERGQGCVFAARCPVALDRCFAEKPELETMSTGRFIKCHRWVEIDGGTLPVSYRNRSGATVENKVGTPFRMSGDQTNPPEHILKTEGITKTFGGRSLLNRLLMRRSNRVQAVREVSISVRRYSTLGLVGESGSGKTTLARCIVGLETADDGGMTLLEAALPPALAARPAALKREIQMVFQNPADTLNSYQTIGQMLRRTLERLSESALTPPQMDSRIAELLGAVRLPIDYVNRFPNELSGGEKQRVALARAFAASPALVVADEPTSALDVSVQAVILNLLKDLRAREGASYLFISHDLRAVSYLADWLVVMYQGQIMEEGTTDHVYSIPSHPYTEALISAIPTADPLAQAKRIRLVAEPHHDAERRGCPFAGRCPRQIGRICEDKAPPWRDAGGVHYIRCHIPIDELIALQSNGEPPQPQPSADEAVPA
jgi:peptide/nickel transport system ATP-binding protein